MKRSDLTLDERYLIHNAVLCGLMPDEVARALRRDRSTIYDELKRGRRHRGGNTVRTAHNDAMIALGSAVGAMRRASRQHSGKRCINGPRRAGRRMKSRVALNATRHWRAAVCGAGPDRPPRQKDYLKHCVSHDLRTPLSRLRLGIEMLPADPATRSDLEQDIQDINLVIDQFLDFARDESGEPAQRMRLTQLAQGAVERAARMQVVAKTDLAELPPLMLRPVAMQRAIDNLVNNAARHGGGDILIQTLRDPATGKSLLSVLDRGPGIPVHEVERLKKAFTRMDGARSGESGAGLGLAIVERISRMHEAKFDLLPRVGGGTEARLTFPV